MSPLCTVLASFFSAFLYIGLQHHSSFWRSSLLQFGRRALGIRGRVNNGVANGTKGAAGVVAVEAAIEESLEGGLHVATRIIHPPMPLPYKSVPARPPGGGEDYLGPVSRTRAAQDGVPGSIVPKPHTHYNLLSILHVELNRPHFQHRIDYAYSPPQAYNRTASSFGKGSHGEVWRAVDTRTGERVVMKKIDTAKSSKIADAGKREVHFGTTLPPHPNTVKYHDHFYEANFPSTLWMVFEDHGSTLRQYMYVPKVMSEDDGENYKSVIWEPSPLWERMRAMAASRGGVGRAEGYADHEPNARGVRGRGG